jgi:hypothetical protein
MEERAPSDPRWARVGDLLLLLLMTLAASVAVSGGVGTRLWGIRLAVTSAQRVLLWAAVLVVLRHVIVPRPSVLTRVASALARPRTAVAWLVGAVALCALGVVSARLLQEQVGFTDEQIRQRLFAELQPSSLTNCRFERFGEPNDGGYLMCGNLLGAVKSGYSYGIAGYDQWGCDVSTRLGVKVHEYDCFEPRRPSCPGGDLLFHDECVAGRRYVHEGRLFDTLSNQMANNGDGGRAAVLKIDVEGAEWDSLLQAPEGALDRLDQIAVEFHGFDARALPVVRKLKKLFYVAHVHFNNASCTSYLGPFPSWAYEVTLVNKRIGKPDRSYARYFAELRAALWLVRPAPPASPLDAPNDPKIPDCQAR